jgi:hypothetical protein
MGYLLVCLVELGIDTFLYIQTEKNMVDTHTVVMDRHKMVCRRCSRSYIDNIMPRIIYKPFEVFFSLGILGYINKESLSQTGF